LGLQAEAADCAQVRAGFAGWNRKRAGGVGRYCVASAASPLHLTWAYARIRAILAEQGEMIPMKKITLVLLGGAALSMAACQKNANEVAADNVEANVGNIADNLDAAASNTSNDAAADSLKNQADSLKDNGDKLADNVAAGNVSEATANKAVNAM
jgi:hypothetical protein